MIVFEHWKHSLSPSAAALEPLISPDSWESCTEQRVTEPEGCEKCLSLGELVGSGSAKGLVPRWASPAVRGPAQQAGERKKLSG